jgi:hypothetical protein
MELRALCLAGILFGVSYCAYGEAVFETTADGIRLVLHKDQCALKEVTNLPFKAVWHENGKEVEGCWAPRPDAGIAVFYFADKTVGVAPLSSFRRLISS